MADTDTTGNGGTTPAVTRLFAQPPVTVDGNVTLDGQFTPATDSSYYNSPYYTQNKNSVQPFPANTAPGIMDLANVLPADTISAITASNQITFHSVGDTGATT